MDLLLKPILLKTIGLADTLNNLKVALSLNHASKILQRTFVGVDFFSVFQEVYLRTSDPRVSNIVKFSDAVGELKVEVRPTISPTPKYHHIYLLKSTKELLP